MILLTLCNHILILILKNVWKSVIKLCLSLFNIIMVNLICVLRKLIYYLPKFHIIRRVKLYNIYKVEVKYI